GGRCAGVGGLVDRQEAEFFNSDEPFSSADDFKAAAPKSAFDPTGLDDPESNPAGAQNLLTRGEDHTDELPAPISRPGASSPGGLLSEAVAADGSPAFFTGYDKGFIIHPSDPDDFPFSFKFNNQTQVRYTAFDAGERTWTDSTGAVLPITDRSNFEIPRGRAVFSGFV